MVVLVDLEEVVTQQDALVELEIQMVVRMLRMDMVVE